jgi:hypothetical protein
MLVAQIVRYCINTDYGTVSSFVPIEPPENRKSTIKIRRLTHTNRKNKEKCNVSKKCTKKDVMSDNFSLYTVQYTEKILAHDPTRKQNLPPSITRELSKIERYWRNNVNVGQRRNFTVK